MPLTFFDTCIKIHFKTVDYKNYRSFTNASDATTVTCWTNFFTSQILSHSIFQENLLEEVEKIGAKYKL